MPQPSPAFTITLPNHTGMITDRAVVGETGHGWIGNSDPKLGQTLHRNKGSYIDSMFAVAHDHGLRTALLASKTKFSAYDLSYNERSGAPDSTGEDNGRDKLDTFAIETESDCLVEWFASLFQATEDPPDLAMLHLRDPDSAGPAHGPSLRHGSEYLEAVAHSDQLVGRLLEVIDSDPALRGSTYVIVTADHGGLEMTKGHGESEEWQNFRIGFFVWGGETAHGADLYSLNPSTREDPADANPADDAGSIPPVRNADAANLALSLLGLPPFPGSTANANQDLRMTGQGTPKAPGR
jgi:hypothetical protein